MGLCAVRLRHGEKQISPTPPLWNLKPDTEYAVRVGVKNDAGEGKPQLFRMRTSPTGRTDNVIPFPER